MVGPFALGILISDSMNTGSQNVRFANVSGFGIPTVLLKFNTVGIQIVKPSTIWKRDLFLRGIQIPLSFYLYSQSPITGRPTSGKSRYPNENNYFFIIVTGLITKSCDIWSPKHMTLHMSVISRTFKLLLHCCCLFKLIRLTQSQSVLH